MDYPKSLAWVGLLLGKFTNGTQDGSVKPSADPAEWANAVTDEILAVITAAGMEPDEADTTQLSAAIIKIIVSAEGITRPQFETSLKHATTEFVQRALGSLAGALSFGVNTAMDITEVGKIIGPTAGGLTFTLPPSASAPPGALIHLNGNGFGLTVARAGADLIVTPPNSVATFALGALDSAVFRRSTGGGAWILDAGSAFLKYTTAFSAVVGGSGYQRLPSGLIMQWGSVIAGVDTGVTFPLAFPSSCFFTAVSPGNYNAAAAVYQRVVPIAAYGETKTGFVASSSNGAALRGVWIALGY